MLVDIIQVQISVETRHDFSVGPAQTGIEPILKPHLISRSVLFGDLGTEVLKRLIGAVGFEPTAP